MMKFVFLATVICCSLIPSVTMEDVKLDWGPVQICPNDGVVKGFKLKLGNSRVTGVRFLCSNGGEITSKELPSGIWSDKEFRCPDKTWLDSCLPYELSEMNSKVIGNLHCLCSNNDALKGNGLDGPINILNWSLECKKGINGIRTGAEKDAKALYRIQPSCKE